MVRIIKFHRYDLTKLPQERKQTTVVKQLNFLSRYFCAHDFEFIGIDNTRKVYACNKCGQLEVEE